MSSNSSLDGSGHKIIGNASNPAISLSNISDVSIKNLAISGTSIANGITVNGVNRLTIEDVDIKNDVINNASWSA
jgi:hypothetical protein